jgi:hypothetical protein
VRNKTVIIGMQFRVKVLYLSVSRLCCASKVVCNALDASEGLQMLDTIHWSPNLAFEAFPLSERACKGEIN